MSKAILELGNIEEEVRGGSQESMVKVGGNQASEPWRQPQEDGGAPSRVQGHPGSSQLHILRFFIGELCEHRVHSSVCRARVVKLRSDWKGRTRRAPRLGFCRGQAPLLAQPTTRQTQDKQLEPSYHLEQCEKSSNKHTATSLYKSVPIPLEKKAEKAAVSFWLHFLSPWCCNGSQLVSRS